MNKKNILIILLAAMTWFHFAAYSYGAIPASERAALIALYNSTNGDNWKDNSGWKTPPLDADGFAMPGTEDDWYGITVLSGHVSVLGLTDNNLDGVLPPELYTLTYLRQIFLAFNSLTGSIPPELGNLTGLIQLDLQINQFSGEVPVEIGQLTRLMYLELYSNQFTGSLPRELGNLVNLIELNLRANRFSGSIPTELGNLDKLTELRMSSNEFTGAIPSSLGNLSNLKLMWMGFNNLTGTIPRSLGNLTRLEELILCSNDLGGDIPTEIYGLTALKVLRLEYNELTGTIHPRVGDLTQLETLRLCTNHLEGNIPPEIGRLTRAKWVDLYSNKLKGEIPATITNLTNLEPTWGSINIDHNGLYTGNDAVRAFLDRENPGWHKRQTTPPENVSASALSTDTIEVSWAINPGIGIPGGFEVYYSSQPTGPWTYAGITANLLVSSYAVTGLTPGKLYYFALKTRTPPHMFNDNTIISDFSQWASASTLLPDNTFLLTLQSTPYNGAGITVSPNDYHGNGNGTTTFTRLFTGGTAVTLTAPASFNNGNFLKWTIDGVDYADRTVQVTMDAGHTATVVYEHTVPPETYTLTVQSSPAGGASITVTPNDNDGNGNGATTFTRTYNEGTAVSLTAPLEYKGKRFSKWTVDGKAKSGRTLGVAMDGDHTVIAYYEEGPPPDTCTLTVQSSPNDGASITVSPADNNGNGDGETSFTRTYDDGTAVTLTAPAEHEGKVFSKWRVDGVDNTERTVRVTMDADHMATAVYEEDQTPETYTLTVESTTAGGAYVTVSPADEDGNGDGTTKFTRTYTEGTVVTLTAPAEHKDKKFARWHVDGVERTNSLTVEIAITGDHKAKAHYVTPSRPGLVLSRGKINFGYVNGDETPPVEALRVTINGDPVDWTAETDVSWLSVDPVSGFGTTETAVSVIPDGLAPAKYTGTIVVTAPDADNSPQSVNVTLTVYEDDSTTAPVGEFSTPMDGSTVYSSVPVTGWVVDDIGVKSVKLYREEGKRLIFIGDAIFVEGARTDIEELYPDYPGNYRAGWGYMLLTHFFPDGGNGTFTLHAVAADVEGNTVTLGTKTVTCDNANAVKPFGAIDTPLQGGTVSGASGGNYTNWGWVLTPRPNSIPTDGSTIDVYVDGVKVGNPTYNMYREDIATFFPGYANSDGAVGRFSLDTTAYEDGVHTIMWVATDDAGNADGIGSRYFTIQNSQGTVSRMESGRPFSQIPVDYWEPLAMRKGYGQGEPRRVYPDDKGIVNIEIEELERIEIGFSPYGVRSGSLVVGNEWRTLPAGSTLDTGKGIFYWQPGAGYVGEYRFVFAAAGPTGEPVLKRLTVDITPKF